MDINFTLIAQAIAFAVLIWFTVKFIWPPLLTAIEMRQREIADGLAAAHEGKNALEIAAKVAEQTLNEAKQKASDIIGQAEKRGASILEEAKVHAKLERERILAQGKAEVEQEIHRAREMLRQQVSALAVAGATKILRKEIDAKTHSVILEQLAIEL